MNQLILIHTHAPSIYNKQYKTGQYKMISGVYQFRKFISMNNLHIDYSNAFVDVYFCQRGWDLIGVKFREPKRKDYGWKLEEFQCKIASVEIHSSGLQIQKWKKYKYKLNNSLKLKTTSNPIPHNLHNPTIQTQQQPDPIATKQQKLQQKACKIYNEISQSLLASGIGQKTIIKNWCADYVNNNLDHHDLEIFVVQKDKNKVGGKEVGMLKISRIVHHPQVFWYETQCVEGTDIGKILERFRSWGVENVSYPKLLTRLMVPSKQKQQKIEQQKH